MPQPPGTSRLRPGEKVPKSALFLETGGSGLRQFGGLIREEFRRELVGRKGAEAYREMASNSSVLGSALLAIELPCRRASWYLEPAETPDGEDVAEFVEQCREDMSTPWGDVLQEVLTMVQYGWAFMETVYKVRNGYETDPPSRYDDGRVGWRKMSLRAQDSLDRWEIDPNGGIRGMWQRLPYRGTLVGIPIEKAQLFRTSKVRNNPEGRSLLRTAYFAWYHAKRMMANEGIGVERDLTGVPSAGVPADMLLPSAPPEQKQALEAIKRALRDLKMDEQGYIVYPLEYDAHNNPRFKLELLASPGRRTHDTTAIISRYELRMAQALLAGFLMLGQTAVGSRALADPLIDFFLDSVGALLDSVADTFNRFGIPALLAVNGISPEHTPKLCHGPVKTQDLAELGTFIKVLSDAGMPLFPNPELERHLMEAADLPEPAAGAQPKEDPNADDEGDDPAYDDDEPEGDDVDDDDAPQDPDGKGEKKPKGGATKKGTPALRRAVEQMRMMARRRKPPRGAKMVLRELEHALTEARAK